MSITHSNTVLEQLGVNLPSSPENEVIVQELLDTKQRLSGLSKSSLKSLPIMSDLKKIQTMAILENVMIRCYQSQSKYFPIIAIRMVRITLQYGSSKYSAVGKFFFPRYLPTHSTKSNLALIPYTTVVYSAIVNSFRSYCVELCHCIW